MTTSRVDFDELAHLATEVRRAQSSLDAGVKGFSAASVHGETPFGNTPAGVTSIKAYVQAETTMGLSLKAFANTIDSDAERLELALALYKQTDAESADTMLTLDRNRLDVYSAQLSTTEHPASQATELDRLRGLVGGPPQGSAIVAGDFNAVPSTPGVGKFGERGFDVHAGDIHDGPGGTTVGTSKTNQPIDYVMPRGVGTSEAQRWDRSPSDHDGQLTDVTMPNW